MKIQNLLIPTSLLTYSIGHNLTKQLRIYSYFKAISSGVLIPDYTEVSKALRMHPRTLKRHLNWLITHNWIGTDGTRLFIRKWSRIYGYLKLEGKTGIYLPGLHVLQDENEFKAFAVAGTLAQIVKWMKHVKYLQDRRYRRSIPSKYLTASGHYYGISNAKLAQILKVSLETSKRLKRLAIAKGYVKTKERFKEIGKADSAILHSLKYQRAKETNLPFLIKDDQLLQQLPNEIIPKVRVKKCRRLPSSPIPPV